MCLVRPARPRGCRAGLARCLPALRIALLGAGPFAAYGAAVRTLRPPRTQRQASLHSWPMDHLEVAIVVAGGADRALVAETEAILGQLGVSLGVLEATSAASGELASSGARLAI